MDILEYNSCLVIIIHIMISFNCFASSSPAGHMGNWELQHSARSKGHFALYNCLVLGHTKYNRVQRVYCNPFPQKPYHDTGTILYRLNTAFPGAPGDSKSVQAMVVGCGLSTRGQCDGLMTCNEIRLVWSTQQSGQRFQSGTFVLFQVFSVFSLLAWTEKSLKIMKTIIIEYEHDKIMINNQRENNWWI